ncbi:hypothetical protein Moror_10828 [Moniliophthora roreri MCA 2997]|uniref:BTB domain-containing protein n=2 Tax=Moniliophthora roreri TaxID=221103 RepID=V2WMD5_MONRO|nr:hypothetical protein Moror_10828 [Moniliophthora roreri MCA 2997]KAI3621338.1 hypothetical protein WG66_014358 [Moniliophthora roreri]
MGRIDLLDPTHKVQFLVELFRRGSRQKQRAPHRNHGSNSTQDLKTSRPRHRHDVDDVVRTCFIDDFTSSTASSDDMSDRMRGVERDHEYFCDSSTGDDQCCLLRVEDTLFRVLRLVLCRDNSVFSKRLWFGRRKGSETLALPGDVERFRDLLWALHTLPPDFHFGSQFSELENQHYTHLHDVPLPRLLNIAELASEYSYPTFQHWAVEKIYYTLLHSSFEPFTALNTPTSSISTSSSITLVTLGNGLSSSKHIDPDVLYGRIMEISLKTQHHRLLDLLVQQLITKVLWCDYVPGSALIRVMKRHHRSHKMIDILLGAVHYRMLINLPQFEQPPPHNTFSPPQPLFPYEMAIEERMEFLAAHHSLTQLWKKTKNNAPELRTQSHEASASSPPSSKRSSKKLRSSRRASANSSESDKHLPHDLHSSCKNTWRRVWLSACSYAENQIRRHSGSPCDVLGMLKVTMLRVRKLTADDCSICLHCSLEGLEALDVLRDQVIDGLPGMFSYT